MLLTVGQTDNAVRIVERPAPLRLLCLIVCLAGNRQCSHRAYTVLLFRKVSAEGEDRLPAVLRSFSVRSSLCHRGFADIGLSDLTVLCIAADLAVKFPIWPRRSPSRQPDPGHRFFSTGPFRSCVSHTACPSPSTFPRTAAGCSHMSFKVHSW